VARYIVRNDEHPDDVFIALVWRSTVMPAEAVRKTEVEALKAEFDGILNWESSLAESGRVVMHT